MIIGLIVVGGSIFSRVDRQGTSFKYGWPFVLIGLTVGLLVGGVVLIAARQAGIRPTTTEMVAVLVVCAAVGALLGLALAPPKVEPEDVSPLTKKEQQQRERRYGDLPDGARAGPVDRDGDGQPDVDQDGNPIIGLDRDGDGVVDDYLVPCPEGSPTPRLPEGGMEVRYLAASVSPTRAHPIPVGSSPEDGQIIDQHCDGTVDRVIPYSDRFLTPPGGGINPDLPESPESPESPELPETPSTISPQERAEQADQKSAASPGQLLKIIGIGVGVLALVALVAWLVVQWTGRSPKEEEEPDDEPISALPPPAAPNPNFQRSIEDLIADPDPRNGILAAYGRLLIGFDEIGLGRMPQEGPQEHLDRALAASSADPAAAKELASWFTVARFSDHPITESDRQTAVDALRRVTATIRPRAAQPIPVAATP